MLRCLAATFAAAFVCLHAATPSAAPARRPPELIVFAAADLGPAFRQIAPPFETSRGVKVTLVLGSTGTLAQQIRNGAPADVFFAANQSFIDQLASDGAVVPDSRVQYARGRIVMATRTSALRRVATLRDLTDPKIRRVSIANPAHAPYGLAAEQALRTARLWDAVRPKLVYGENVQQAVQFVQTGAVDAGIVARALADVPDLHWQFIDASLHAPINQTAAVVTRSQQRSLARAFLDHVTGTESRAVLRQLGFLLPGADF